MEELELYFENQQLGSKLREVNISIIDDLL